MLPNEQLIVKKTIQVLSFEEGYSETAYLDTNDYLTIAGGFKMSSKKGLDPKDFEAFKIPKEAGDVMKKLKIEREVLPQFEQRFPDLYLHSPERVAIYLSMIYQMGLQGFSGFRNTIRLLKDQRFSEASTEALDSVWAGPVERGGTPERAKRHSEVIKDPVKFEEYYER